MDPCGLVMDWVREFYDTYMQFGTNSSRIGKVRWFEASPQAKDFPFPTPFVSRNWDQWEIWPEVGEVQWAPRIHTDGKFPIIVPGTGEFCGKEEVWRHGTIGTPQPIYPRNMFGLAACCGGLIAPLGQPTFGLQVQIGFSVTPTIPVGFVAQDIVKDDPLADLCGTLDLRRKETYPSPFVPHRIEVDELDDSNPQRELIFGLE